MSIQSKFDQVIQYQITAKCREPLHIGAASGELGEVLIHPIERVPFVQATSIAGVFRANWSAESRDEMLGSACGHNASRVVFGDGAFERTTVSLERRPRLKMDHEKGVGSGQKFEMNYVPEGAVFSFPITVYCYAGDEKRYGGEIERVLSMIHQGDVQFGGQKTNGCGFLTILKAEKREYSMTSPEERACWYRGEGDVPCQDVLDVVKQGQERMRYRIVLRGEVDRSILIKALAPEGTGLDNADSVHIQSRKDGKLAYILPASSIKGVCQNQAEKIMKYMGCESIENPLEHVVFLDAILRDTKDELQHRIRIDKFTGGVMDKGLFSERAIQGDLEMKFDVPVGEPVKAGLLLTVLRDVALGQVSFGSGRNVGRGYIKVNEIEVQSPEGTCAIIKMPEGEVSGQQELVENMYKAWKEAVRHE